VSASAVGFGTRPVATVRARVRGLSRYERLVALGFLLLGVVRVEPAPSDALLAVAAVAWIGSRGFDLRRVPPAMLWTLVALIALNLVSASQAVDLGIGMRYLGITLNLFVLAIWLTTWATTPRRVRVVVGAYVAGAAVSAGIAILAALGAPLPGRATLIGEGVRAQGLFKDPNVFGAFLIPAALIVLEELVRPRLFRLRGWAGAALLGLLVLGIVFAYSRAAWLDLGLALVVMLGVMTARADAGPRVLVVLGLVLAVGAVAGATVALSGSASVLRERAQAQRYDTERFAAQRSGIRLAEAHPLGIGPGQFEVVEPIASHSIYVRVLSEQGVLGLAALVALLGGTLLLAAQNALLGRDTYGVGSAALLGAWCGLLANSAFIDTLHWRHLWLVAALVWIAARRSPAR
jgi:O-antigen ligase